jgi:hypothetical protein
MIQKLGPGGLEILVQHDASSPFTATWAWPPHRSPKAKETVAAGEKLGVVRRTEVTVGPHV